MKSFRVPTLLAWLILLAAPCFAHHMAVVVSPENTTENINSAELGRIFRCETKKWTDGREIHLVVNRSSEGQALTLQRLNKMSVSQWQTWIKEHKHQLTFVDSDQEVLNLVGSTPGAIGLVDVRSVNDHVRVVHVDGKLPLETGYLPH
jgi:ABC-type phosphate transport system substrate-binding protein